MSLLTIIFIFLYLKLLMLVVLVSMSKILLMSMYSWRRGRIKGEGRVGGNRSHTLFCSKLGVRLSKAYLIDRDTSYVAEACERYSVVQAGGSVSAAVYR